jgi:hypothetical protein
MECFSHRDVSFEILRRLGGFDLLSVLIVCRTWSDALQTTQLWSRYFTHKERATMPPNMSLLRLYQLSLLPIELVQTLIDCLASPFHAARVFGLDPSEDQPSVLVLFMRRLAECRCTSLVHAPYFRAAFAHSLKLVICMHHSLFVYL